MSAGGAKARPGRVRARRPRLPVALSPAPPLVGIMPQGAPTHQAAGPTAPRPTTAAAHSAMHACMHLRVHALQLSRKKSNEHCPAGSNRAHCAPITRSLDRDDKCTPRRRLWLITSFHFRNPMAISIPVLLVLVCARTADRRPTSSVMTCPAPVRPPVNVHAMQREPDWLHCHCPTFLFSRTCFLVVCVQC